MMEYCRRKGTDFRLIAPACLEVELLGMQSAHRFDCMGLTFNRMIPQSVIDAFRGQIFNLHLSLLPALPGFDATKRALLAGRSLYRCRNRYRTNRSSAKERH